MPHEPGHIPDEELLAAIEGDGGGDDGLQRGQTVFAIGRDGSLIPVQVGIGNNGRITMFDAETGQVFLGQGGQFLTSASPSARIFVIDSNGQMLEQPRRLTQGELGALGLDIQRPGPAGGGGLTFGQRQQLEAEARGFQSEEAELQRGFSAEEAEKQRQFGLKRDAAAEAASLIQQQTGLREQARNLVTEMFGKDPFRGALAAQGALSVGSPTPVRAFEEELRGVAGQPIPEALGAEATLPQLEEQTAGLRQTVQGGLPRPGILAAAHGATIDMERGGDGVFSVRRGETGQGMLVGESGPEVIEFTPQGTVRVIPLTRKAQGGLSEFDPFEQFDTAPAIGRALQPAFEAIGFGGQIPLGQTGTQGQALTGAFGSFGGEGLTLQPGRVAETFGMLGVRPSLLQIAGTDEFLFRSPEGELRKIGGLADVQAAGFNIEEATVVARSELPELGQFGGEPQTGLPTAELRPFAQRATPLRMPLSVDDQGLPDRSGPSIFLPSPRQFAGTWGTLGPDLQGLLLSGWKLAGLSPANAERELKFFTPRGTASQFSTAALR